MTLIQKSLALWIGGAAVGLVAARAFHKPALGGAFIGAALVGGIGDKVLEQRERTLASAGN